jgi:membrane protease YdiL (CAAX protease family)
VFALLLIPEVAVALGEEYGWRGYLMPRLLPLDEIRASLLVGLIWSLWHLPALLAGVLYGGNNPWLVLLVFAFSTTMNAFVYTWFSAASRGSVMVASVLHGSFNWSANRLLRFLSDGNLLAISLTAGLVLLGVVVVVYGVFRRLPVVSSVATQDLR